jgi:hypothetical protein
VVQRDRLLFFLRAHRGRATIQTVGYTIEAKKIR